MLVVSRRPQESVYLATASGRIAVAVHRILGGRVRLGIDAPQSVRVSRTEEKTMDGVWAIVEVFGRQSFAGETMEVDFLGAKFLEVRVPEHVRHGESYPETTKRFPASAIYAFSPCSEEYARRYQEGWEHSRVFAFTLPFSPPPAVAAGGEAPVAIEAQSEDDDEGFDDLTDVMDGLSVPSFATGGDPIKARDPIDLVELRKEVQRGA